ncbi:hypothetical protein [Paractinoplanes atraurantiacus]|uniref:DUF5667 domain-containing protein n=1 Tax=Paractinoplanes atraurantiacus TaxID=1036182 RepID=A0A285JSC4_9ACTN|nr:hypothetical protein [Actinoplanes atraurantiacus]SNY63158.1 hypothetical protein SAMN05421748_12514 [Actinoplanes atraurantiacus]
MTGLGVGRTRTAHLPIVPPTGDSTPVPPHIQGAEWRSEGRARRHTGSRWGLRVLVVGGLAGAAWLLTGAAAHAADRVDGPDGSLLGSVIGADTTAPVTGLLQAAVQPLEAERPDHERHLTDILDVPQRVLSHPAETVDEVRDDNTGTPVDAAVSDVDQVLSDVTGTIRLIGGPETPQRLTAVTDAVTETVDPDDDRQEPTETDRPLKQQPDDEPADAGPASPVTITKASRAPVAGHHAAVPVKHRKVSSAPLAHRHHHHARAAQAAKVVAPERAGEESTPGGDEPAAVLRLRLGDVSGTPTSGSGTPTEGGSAAFLPAAIAGGTMASHLAAIASDVEARQHDAEAPTVSPD